MYKSNFVINAEALISMLIILICVFIINFFKLNIKLDKTSIYFGYFLFKKNIKYIDIKEINIVEVNALSNFGGWGYRINFRGEIGFVLNSGNCIKIITKDDKVYYISFNKKYLPILLNNEFIKIIK